MPSFADLISEATRAHVAGDLCTAERIYDRLLAADPGHAGLLQRLGTLYGQKGRNGLALSLLSRAVDLQPNLIEAWNNLGCALRSEGHGQAARLAFERALALAEGAGDEAAGERDLRRQRAADALANLSGLSVNAACPERAERQARAALALVPEHPQARNHLALSLLEQGQWVEGWRHYTGRWRLPGWQARPYECPVWDGRAIPGERPGALLLHGEQGIGDEILFLGAAAEAAPRSGRRLVFEVTRSLVPLVSRSFRAPAFVDPAQVSRAGVRLAARCALGDLPGLVWTGAPQRRSRYLIADPVLVAAARERLKRLGPPPYVAIAWQGGTKITNARERSVPLPLWAPLLATGATFVSVQYGAKAPLEAAASGLPHWPELIEDLDAQAGLISACDLVISVCQTAIHLAGALGTPAWVLTPATPAWRYGLPADRSHRHVVVEPMPFYRDVTLFRQPPHCAALTAEGDPAAGWSPVIAALAAALSSWREAGTVQPVSTAS